MLPKPLQAALNPHLPSPVISVTPVTGGCIHNALKLTTQSGPFFLKYNKIADAPMFNAEADGLRTLHQAAAIEVPLPIAQGVGGDHAFLLLPWIESAPRAHNFWEDLGQKLAHLHRHTQPQHGYHRDNFIGSLPQVNRPLEDWRQYFVERRLIPMAGMARKAGLLDADTSSRLDSLLGKIDDLIPAAAPSLLHGDLWQGNVMTGPDGCAALIDPAVYYGHREAEMAFTRLFAGFHEWFYQAYNEAWPMEPGWQERVDIYNLYPLMVHLNLFGRSYLPDIQETVRKFT
ncbi:MAG: fructosamine kinase family protein [Bacteroidia bacterium]